MEKTNYVKKLAAQAQSAYKAKKYLLAAELFQTLENEYGAAGNMLAKAEMANNRSVALLMAGKSKEAFEAAEKTDKVFIEKNDHIHAAMALGNQAAALEEMKHYEEALALYQKSIELLEQTKEPELKALILKKISALQVRAGRNLEATASMYAALKNKKKLTGMEKTLKGLLDKLFGLMGIKNKS